MSGPPSCGQDLLNRLNALKKSSITLETDEPRLSISRTQSTPETDLSARLRSLRSGTGAGTAAGTRAGVPLKTYSKPQEAPAQPAVLTELNLDTDDKELESLLDDIQSSNEWVPEHIDKTHIQLILKVAQTALAKGKRLGAKGPIHSNLALRTEGASASSLMLDQGSGGLESDEEKGNPSLDDESHDAQEIITRIVDEVELERMMLLDAAQNGVKGEDEDRKAIDAPDRNNLELPGVPMTDPESSQNAVECRKNSIDFESSITARVAALKGPGGGKGDSLGLPSAPTTSLGKASKRPSIFKEDVSETWCVICQDDATVQCYGCEDALYCARCWKEGHIGPDAGWEEKSHEWTKYKRPR